eukprot:130243_1
MANYTSEYDCISIENKCKHTINTIKTMIYYQSLDLKVKTQRHSLVKYCKEQHLSLLDDYIHIVTKHNNNIENIWNLMKSQFDINECNFSNCLFANRHNNRHNTDKFDDMVDGNNEEFLFYHDFMDAAHCYLFHLYDAGFRIKIDNNQNETDDQVEQQLHHYDNTFAKICKIVETKKLENVDENRYSNNKFSITMHASPDVETTFIDGLYYYLINYLKEQKVFDVKIELIQKMMANEEYDTDSLLQDVSNEQQESNLARFLNDTDQYSLVQRYVIQSKLHQHSFNTGFIFYYWNYYKTAQQKQEYEQWFDNENDHSGYLPHQLYIPNKYTSLKEEILNNTIYCLKRYQFRISLKKAKEYIQTNQAKSIILLSGDSRDDPLHYNIISNTKLSIENLLSVLLYCDWGKLSTEFSKTFRKIKTYETVEMVKQRNREYRNWSKILRETVQYYGNGGWYYGDDENTNVQNNRQRGPFYCGMSSLLIIPQFNIRLCSPTSTSKQIAV